MTRNCSPRGVSPVRRSYYQSPAYKKKLADFYKEYKEAFERSSSCKSSDDEVGLGPDAANAKTVESDRWWPGKCFRKEEIRSPPMTSKKLRNLGFLSHSNLPNVNSELLPFDEE